MKLVIDVNKDTSKLLTDLIEKLNSTKISDLNKSRNRLKSMIDELSNQLVESPEKVELIEFFNECVDNDDELVTIDKDPNIIDNKTLININTRKMDKKDLIKQEIGEIESILKNKAYSQLLAKYHSKLFSEVEGLEGEDVEEIKERLDEIADQLEDISNTEAATDESVEVTDEEVESPEGSEAEEITEEATEETAEVPAEEDAEETEEAEESTEEATEEVAEEDAEEEVKSESAEEDLEATESEAEESDKDEHDLIVEKIEEIDEEFEELKEAVETKDFSKVIARVHSRLFSEIEDHEELIENIDEVKEAMDDLAEKIEKLDAECDEDAEDKHEGEDAEVEDAEHAEEEAHDADEQEAEEKTESEKCMSCGVTVKFNDGTQHHYDSREAWEEELDRINDDKDSAKPVEIIEDRCESEDEAEDAPAEEVVEEKVEEVPAEEEAAEEPELITGEEVEKPLVEEPAEVPSTQEVEAIAEQAAEEAVEEYMENGLFMNEVDEGLPEVSETEALISEEVPQKEAEVEPMYIDEKTDMVLDQNDDVVTESDEIGEMEDEDLYMEESDEMDFCNKTFSKGRVISTVDTDKYPVASIDELLGL